MTPVPVCSRITNRGEPLVDTTRVIDTPPRSRNEDLATLMRRLHICEEDGSRRGVPAPSRESKLMLTIGAPAGR